MNGQLNLALKKDKLTFGQFFKTYYTLDIKNITNVQYKSEQEISKDVTLTRLLAFGIFAFGLKKKKTNNSYFIIISTLEDEFENDIVLEIENTVGLGATMAQGFIKTLRNEVIKYKQVS
jgi:hypothetical protein